MKKPLKGLLVLEFSQFLAAPSAGLRLADLGARVIKVERPQGGDAGRKLSLKNIFIGEDSLLFHSINRNKESFTADLKNAEDLKEVKALIAKADVLTHNFRPGVMEKIGLDYASVKQLNESMVYAEVTGYGRKGPWAKKPGQDLLLQSLSGLTYLTGNTEHPTPFGLSIADIYCGAHLVQGILAALLLRNKTGMGSYVEVSLLESILDFQFEFLTTCFNSGTLPQKSKVSHAHSLLSAPYGIYKTIDGYISLGMCDIQVLGKAINLPLLSKFTKKETFSRRDEIKTLLTEQLCKETMAAWLEKLKAHNIWSMPVLNWKELQEQEGYRQLGMTQTVETPGGQKVTYMQGPIRINRHSFPAAQPAPLLGAHKQSIKNEFNL